VICEGAAGRSERRKTNPYAALDENRAQIVGAQGRFKNSVVAPVAEVTAAQRLLDQCTSRLDGIQMTFRARTFVTPAVAALLSTFASASVVRSHPAGAAGPALPVGAASRVLVVAPHPDDETLAAGGLIQRLHAAGGALRVVFLTDGDGFPEGVKAEEGRENVTASDYRAFGRERKDEARAALHALGIHDDTATFLGFPDGGLSRMLTGYWSDRRPPYLSPYTRRNRPAKSELLDADARFHGEDVTQELATLIAAFRPTAILTPRKEDQHVDHCAAWFFVADALGDVTRVDTGYRADVLTYIVHFKSWPYESELPALSGGAGWLRLRLTDREMAQKREAIHKYKTQMKVMDWFLEAFVRRTEVFAQPPSPRVQLPLRRSPCDQFKS